MSKKRKLEKSFRDEWFEGAAIAVTALRDDVTCTLLGINPAKRELLILEIQEKSLAMLGGGREMLLPPEFR